MTRIKRFNSSKDLTFSERSQLTARFFSQQPTVGIMCLVEYKGAVNVNTNDSLPACVCNCAAAEALRISYILLCVYVLANRMVSVVSELVIVQLGPQE